jgi:hypothetical protein
MNYKGMSMWHPFIVESVVYEGLQSNKKLKKLYFPSSDPPN